jgi:hypothetical protein
VSCYGFVKLVRFRIGSLEALFHFTQDGPHDCFLILSPQGDKVAFVFHFTA